MYLPLGLAAEMPGPADSPALPEPRGPLSEALLSALAKSPGDAGGLSPLLVDTDDPLADEDLQLALYCSYELHYRSFKGVDPAWEWQPSLIAARRDLEACFLGAVGATVRVPHEVDPSGVGDLLFALAEADAQVDEPSLSEYLQRGGSKAEFREFLIHRSAYQLKEADPHTWAIPRLYGPPKAAMVEIQVDEYGSGDPGRVHAVLFARAMDALGLDSAYGAYLDEIPAHSLATVNLISAFGLNRSLRGALVGHLAMFEITSPVPNSRYAKGLRRLGSDDDALEFFDEHVEADSVHENIAAYDLAQGLALQQPVLATQIVFGAAALLEIENRFSTALLGAFETGGSLLRARDRRVATRARRDPARAHVRPPAALAKGLGMGRPVWLSA